MDHLNNREEILKDLQLIKEAARKNNNILKYISVSEGIKNVALYVGIFIITFCSVFLWMIDNYGSYTNTPDAFKLAVYAISVLSFAGLVWLKTKIFLKLARKYKNDMNLKMLFKEIYTSTFVIISIQFFLSIGVLCVFLSVAGIAHLIVPVLSILVSLLMVALMTTLNLKDFLITIEWLFISGSISLFIAERVSTPVLLILTFGIGMLILYLSAQISISREKRDRVGRK